MFPEDLMHCDIHCINFSNWPNSSCTNSFLLAYTKSSVQYPWSSIIWHFQHTCIVPSISTIPLSLISTPTVHHTVTFVICICAPTQLHVYSSIKVSKIALIRYICRSNCTEPLNAIPAVIKLLLRSLGSCCHQTTISVFTSLNLPPTY